MANKKTKSTNQPKKTINNVKQKNYKKNKNVKRQKEIRRTVYNFDEETVMEQTLSECVKSGIYDDLEIDFGSMQL